MMSFGEVLIALFVVGIPTLMVGLVLNRWFLLKEKKLDVEARLARRRAILAGDVPHRVAAFTALM